MSSEFSSMASQTGLLNALGFFLFTTAIILGAAYWIKKSGGK
jgi:hypothetical protein